GRRAPIFQTWTQIAKYSGLPLPSTPKNSQVSSVQNNGSSKKPAGEPGLAIKSLRKALGSASTTYSVYGAAEIIFKECARHAAYKMPKAGATEEMPTTENGEEIGVREVDAQWYQEFDLPVTFSTWSQVTMLHMYLLVVRIRNMSPHLVQLWQKNLQDQFFFAAEDGMVINHEMTSGSVRAKYLKDLYVQWRGLIAAYDEDIRHLAQIVSYIRHTLQDLDGILAVPELVNFKFMNISAEKASIALPSKTMSEPFETDHKKQKV
ncbi:Bgt-5204, partial [Blumeria graminis f. sp. tritici]